MKPQVQGKLRAERQLRLPAQAGGVRVHDAGGTPVHPGCQTGETDSVSTRISG